MNSREIVRRTLDYDYPERLACSFRDSDIWCFSCVPKSSRATDWKEVGGGRWERTDEWGNTWARVDPTSKGEVVRGVLDEITDIAGYVFPDYADPANYADAKKMRDENPGKWIMGMVPGFVFNIARKMRKLERYLADIMLEPEAMSALHDRIDVLLEAMIRNCAAIGADAIHIIEDWGTQSQTLVSPELWCAEFFPRFKKLCGLAHSLGMRVFMHSCGQIGAIIPGLMEAGVDCLQFDQPDLHGIGNLARFQDSGKITFWCPVDIQKTLQTRDPEIIRSKAYEMTDKLWRGRGGFIAGYYSDNTSIGLDPSLQEIACEVFAKTVAR